MENTIVKQFNSDKNKGKKCFKQENSKLKSSFLIWSKSLILFIAFISCNISSSQVGNKDYLIKVLEEAENSKDLNKIESIFNKDAILYTTDLMPVKGKSGIVSIYAFVFARNDLEKVEYIVDSIINDEPNIYEYGQLKTIRNNGNINSQPFMALFTKQHNDIKIKEISFGKEEELKKVLPKMIEPTGSYHIGQTNYFYGIENLEIIDCFHFRFGIQLMINQKLKSHLEMQM